MAKMFKYFKNRDWIYVALSVALVVLQVWMEMEMYQYSGNLSTAVSKESVTMSVIWSNGLPMLGFAAVSMVAAIICGYLISEVAANFSRTLRADMFNKITDFSNAEINRFSTASLITRTTNDVVQLQMFIAMGVQLIIKAPVTAIWAICEISASNIKWTMAVLITVVVIVVMLSIIVGICYPRFKKIQKLTDDLNGATRENLSGVRVIRAYNADDYQKEKFEKVNTAVTKNHLFTARIMGFMMPIMTLCMNVLSLVIYGIGAVLINDIKWVEGMEFAIIDQRAHLIGDMVQFSQLAFRVVGAFMMLVAIFIILPRTIVSARRIFEVLGTKPTITYPDSDPQTSVKGELEFRGVDFCYPDGSEACIKDISFKIKSGETFAIIGATGSGKTTIINLIPRFFDATKGEVLLDGENIKNFKKDTLNKKVSLASQKAALFKGDIKSNVTYGQGEVADDDPRLEKALSIAKADFALEKGIHAEVAQGGTNLSGGQKQRLSIARAVFKDSEIIIFDDTFSALDYKTDMLVRKSIKEELDGATVIIVAQRIGTIKNADQILVLDKGRIVGLGKHKQLLEDCPVYKEIALSQLSEEEL